MMMMMIMLRSGFAFGEIPIKALVKLSLLKKWMIKWWCGLWMRRVTREKITVKQIGKHSNSIYES